MTVIPVQAQHVFIRSTIHYKFENNNKQCHPRIVNMASWLARALKISPLCNGKYSNIRRVYAGPPPGSPECTRLVREIVAADQGTEELTMYLLRRTGRVKADDERLPFRVTVLFSDGEWYDGRLSLMPIEIEYGAVVQIKFDDGEVHYYNQQELYYEIYGNRPE